MWFFARAHGREPFHAEIQTHPRGEWEHRNGTRSPLCVGEIKTATKNHALVLCGIFERFFKIWFLKSKIWRKKIAAVSESQKNVYAINNWDRNNEDLKSVVERSALLKKTSHTAQGENLSHQGGRPPPSSPRSVIDRNLWQRRNELNENPIHVRRRGKLRVCWWHESYPTFGGGILSK